LRHTDRDLDTNCGVREKIARNSHSFNPQERALVSKNYQELRNDFFSGDGRRAIQRRIEAQYIVVSGVGVSLRRSIENRRDQSLLLGQP